MPKTKRKISGAVTKRGAKRAKRAAARIGVTSIRKQLLGIAETKAINGGTDWSPTIKQNEWHLYDKPSVINAHSENTCTNLLFLQEGAGSHNRNGDVVYGKSLHVKLMFRVPEAVLTGTTSASYSPVTKIRVVVFEGPRNLMTTASVMDSLVNPPTRFTDSEYLTTDLDNQRFRILRDNIITVNGVNQVWQGSVSDEYCWMPQLGLYETKIPLNKKYKYVAGTNQPERMIAIAVTGYNMNGISSGSLLGIIREAHTFYFKDV